MKPIQMLILTIVIILLLMMKGIFDKIKIRKKIMADIRENFGKMPENVYDAKRYEHIGYFFENKKHHGDVIDAITWNDLDM